jgi:hypothetical protein
MPRAYRYTLLVGGLMLWVAASACGDGRDDPSPPQRERVEPLRPLIYTERPDLSEEAAAVRERRLMRQLQQGSSISGSWGSLKTPEQAERPATATAEQLGRAMLEALVGRDEAKWDKLFVAPADYIGMVHVELDEARKFIDDIQGRSRGAWRSFEPAQPSEAPEGGLGEVLEFVELELGQGRTLGGAKAGPEEPVAQYWGNTLKVGLVGTDVVFELRIAKILRIPAPQHNPRQPALALGAPVEVSPQLGVYLRAGLHLKAQLLEPREYPYPLAVGSFWRYRRRLADQEAEPPPERAGGLEATESLLEVVAIDRYDGWRLATLRRSYNDENLTTIDQHWLVTPRRIYRCTSACLRHIEDLGWLLEYIARQAPIFRFPMGLEQAWGAGGRPADSEAVFRVAADWHDVQTQAGSYTNTVAIVGGGPLGAIDPFHRRRSQTRYFAHGRGVVRRELGEPDDSSEPALVEELVESRIMPR